MSVPTFLELIGAPPTVATTQDSVLVIIDAQNEYADGKLATRNIVETRASISALLERYRICQGSVIHVVHDTPEGAPVFTPNTKHAAEFDELLPGDKYKNEPVVHKNYPGSFTATNLEEAIEKSGKRKLVLVGYMAHVCVSTTARQAAEKGYEVVVVSDAVGDRDIPGEGGLVIRGDDLTRTVLAELKDAFATVIASKDIQ